LACSNDTALLDAPFGLKPTAMIARFVPSLHSRRIDLEAVDVRTFVVAPVSHCRRRA
jgi:hypothetical protein